MMRPGGAANQFVGSEKCAACHAAEYKTWKETNHAKMVPATGRTADNLFMRSHAFNKNQNRPGGPTASGQPTYYYK
jgi:hypothetical protein